MCQERLRETHVHLDEASIDGPVQGSANRDVFSSVQPHFRDQDVAMGLDGRCVLRHAGIVIACVALMIVAGVEGEADGAELVSQMEDHEAVWGAPPAEGVIHTLPLRRRAAACLGVASADGVGSNQLLGTPRAGRGGGLWCISPSYFSGIMAARSGWQRQGSSRGTR
jgi:hypothetical protein